MAQQKSNETTDQGWAWVVLVAVVLSQGLSLGFPSCVGVFYTDIQTSFQATNSETSWFPSIVTAVLHAGGPICSILVERYGCRVTVFVGGILAAVGMVSSCFAQTILQLYLTAGFIAGLGLCFAFQAGITVLGYYFVRRRMFANAMASTGASVGLAVWPMMSQYLLDLMGWRGSFLIFGGIFLNCCVCGAVMRPKGPPSSVSDANGEINEESSQNKAPSEPLTDPNTKTHQSACFRTLLKYMAFDLLCQNKRYQIYTLGVTWMVLGFVLPLFYLVPYATSSGIEENQAALLLSILGLINIFVRPVAGLISQMSILKGRLFYVFTTAVMLNGVSNLIPGLWDSYAMLVVYCVFYSVSMSFIGSLIFQVLMDIVGMQRFPSAFGLFTILESVTLLIGPPLAGLLVDYTGQYSYIFYVAAATVCSAALFMGLSTYALRKKESKMQEAAELAPTEPLMGNTFKSDSDQQNPTETVYVTSI